MLSEHSTPWSLEEDSDEDEFGEMASWPYRILDAEGQVVVDFSGGHLPSFELARLLMISPDLLRICKRFVERVESGEVRSRTTYAEIREVLSRYEGEAADG